MTGATAQRMSLFAAYYPGCSALGLGSDVQSTSWAHYIVHGTHCHLAGALLCTVLCSVQLSCFGPCLILALMELCQDGQLAH
jgi:hypothetical protein